VELKGPVELFLPGFNQWISEGHQWDSPLQPEVQA
jgi:hypothetical protein